MSHCRARSTRGVPAMVALVALLSLAACTSSSGDDAAPSPSSSATVVSGPTSAAVAPSQPCPTLPRVKPRADGLPDLELPCLGDGPAVRLSDLRGKPTVVNVWAAWCTNCDREMPLFADAMARAGEGVRFFGIHYKATRDQGLQSEEDFGVPFPSVHDEDGDRVVKDLKAYAPPQTFFVAPDGRVTGHEIGEITSRSELDRLVKRYLGVDL